MLKIKDNVDLKELEKFGFIEAVYQPEIFYEKCLGELGYWINKETRIIEITMGMECDTTDLDTLYDLIQAGLIERLENK